MSVTDYASEETTIFQRFWSSWDTQGYSDDYPVAWDNDEFDPEADAAIHADKEDDAWVRVSVRTSDADQITIGPAGSRDFRHDGVFFAQIFTRAGTGPGLASQITDIVMGLFRGVSADGIIYGAPRKQVVGVDVDDAWYQVNAVVPYRRDSTF